MINSPIEHCRVCARRGIITEASWVLETHETKRYTLCKKHASLIYDKLILDPTALPKGGTKEALMPLERYNEMQQRKGHAYKGELGFCLRCGNYSIQLHGKYKGYCNTCKGYTDARNKVSNKPLE